MPHGYMQHMHVHMFTISIELKKCRLCVTAEESAVESQFSEFTVGGAEFHSPGLVVSHGMKYWFRWDEILYTQLPNMKLAAKVLEKWWICCFWDSAILTVYDNLMEGTWKWRVLFPLFSWSEWDVGNSAFWTSFLSGSHGNHVPNLGWMGYMLFFAPNKLLILQKSDSNSSQSLKWWRISFLWREWPGNFKVRYDQNPGHLLYMGNETLPCYHIGIVSNYKNPYEAISTSWNATRVLNVVSYWSLFLSSQAKKKCAAHWQSKAFWW